MPIIPDEARTFGMDSFFPTLKIYNPHGQLYTAVDAELMLAYKESEHGQILHEGINEAGSTASFTAVGTSYATHGEPMIPMYIFYSMFGFQRTGDGLWAAADQMARGFVLGATAGRTTLTGEGLQHADGHSPLLASTNPAAVAYDPAYGLRDRAHRQGRAAPDVRRHRGVTGSGENIFYYITLYNEPYSQPAEPEDLDVEGLLKGMYLFQEAPRQPGPKAQILVSGVAVPVGAGGPAAARRGLGCRRRRVVGHLLGRAAPRRRRDASGRPASTPAADAPRAVRHAGAVRRGRPGRRGRRTGCARCRTRSGQWVPGDYTTLGTDGFGFSDTRPAARRHFNVDAESIVVAVLCRPRRRRHARPLQGRRGRQPVPHRRRAAPPPCPTRTPAAPNAGSSPTAARVSVGQHGRRWA